MPAGDDCSERFGHMKRPKAEFDNPDLVPISFLREDLWLRELTLLHVSKMGPSKLASFCDVGVRLWLREFALLPPGSTMTWYFINSR